MDFRTIKTTTRGPVHINTGAMERDSGSWESPSQKDLSWAENTSAVVGKAQHRYFLRRLRRANLPPKARQLLQKHHGEHPNKLHDSLAQQPYQKKALQRVVKTVQDIVGIELPSLEHLHSTHCVKRAKNIINITHPRHHLFKLLPSDRHFRSILRSCTLKNSFFPKAVALYFTAFIAADPFSP